MSVDPRHKHIEEEGSLKGLGNLPCETLTQIVLLAKVVNALNGVSKSTAGLGGNQSSNQGGYLLGLGYKQMITNGLYGFVEGNYMEYSSPSYSYQTAKPIDTLHGITDNSTKAATNNFSSLNTYQLLIGVGYAF